MVGERIRNERKSRGLTQARAGEMALISGQFWGIVESGHVRASVCTYLRIAEMFGLTLDDLFYDNATIMRLHKAFSIEGIISECSVTEKAVISETILALKGILERNRSL